jgi:hypothetical protein
MKQYIDMDKKIWINQDGEDICIRKSWDGWRVIYPYKNKDGTANSKNIIGSWQKWLKSFIILLLLLGVFYIYAHDTSLARDTMKGLDEAIKDKQTSFYVGNALKCEIIIDLTPKEHAYNYSQLNLSILK